MDKRCVLNKDTIGKNIKNLLIKSNQTYEGLAEELDLATPRVIYDWINGLKAPSLSRLVRLSQLFKVALEDILFEKDVF